MDSAEWLASMATFVVLSHAFGLKTRYAHLKVTITRGATVQRGDIIGYVGLNRSRHQRHLHYEVWADGRPVNPIRLLVGKGQYGPARRGPRTDVRIRPAFERTPCTCLTEPCTITTFVRLPARLTGSQP